MRNSIFKVTGIVLLLVMSMLCCSCAGMKCAVDQQSCKWDCPETIVLHQACEQKCNISYDICKAKD